MDGRVDLEEEGQRARGITPLRVDERRVLGRLVQGGLWPRKAEGTTGQRECWAEGLNGVHGQIQKEMNWWVRRERDREGERKKR